MSHVVYDINQCRLKSKQPLHFRNMSHFMYGAKGTTDYGAVCNMADIHYKVLFV